MFTKSCRRARATRMRISSRVWGDRAVRYVLYVGDGAPIASPPHDQFLHLDHVLRKPCQVVVQLT